MRRSPPRERKTKRVAAAGILPEGLAHHGGEGIEAAAHVAGRDGHVDADAGGEGQHGLAVKRHADQVQLTAEQRLVGRGRDPHHQACGRRDFDGGGEGGCAFDRNRSAAEFVAELRTRDSSATTSTKAAWASISRRPWYRLLRLTPRESANSCPDNGLLRHCSTRRRRAAGVALLMPQSSPAPRLRKAREWGR